MAAAEARDPQLAAYRLLREQALGVAAVNAAYLAMEQAWEAWMDEEQVRWRAQIFGEPTGALSDSCRSLRAGWEAAAGTLRAALAAQAATPVALPRPPRRGRDDDSWGSSWG